jgi:chromosome segregation ATPase
MSEDLVIRLCDERTALEDANRSLIERNANLEAEVARLRESRVAQLREIERLEQRVAELERELSNQKRIAEIEAQLKDIATACNKTLSAALSSAREILNGRFTHGQMVMRLRALLRAHPEPATPAGQRERRLQAQGFEPVTEEQRADNRLVNLGHATPAATGAEPPAAARRQEIAAATDLSERLIAAMAECDEWGTWADMLRSLEGQGLRVTVRAEKERET